MRALATTFFDEEPAVEVEIVVAYPNGLCKVIYGDRVLVRHKDRLIAINDAARALLK